MEKVAFYTKWILRISIAAAAIYDLFILRWVGIAGGLAILAVTFLIDYINRDKKRINDKLSSLFYVFCMFSLVCGVMLNFYDHIFWWDLLMHLISGALIGIFANSLLNKIQKGKKTDPLLRFLFILGISCVGGLAWEMYEFTVDALLGLDTQKVLISGVSDTMWDLITDLLGGALAGIYFSIFDRKGV